MVPKEDFDKTELTTRKTELGLEKPELVTVHDKVSVEGCHKKKAIIVFSVLKGIRQQLMPPQNFWLDNTRKKPNRIKSSKQCSRL